MMRFIKFNIALLLLLPLFISCNKQSMPKPYGYYRIDLPEPAYTNTNFENKLEFEMSDYARLVPSDEQSGNYDIWRNIEYPQWNARIHLSYKKMNKSDFYELSEESRTLAYKHTIRADAIKEHYYENPDLNTYAILYLMSGNAASSAQFFITDSVSNFLRGSLYFNNIPNFDSIAPVNQFIEGDILRLIESLEWK